MNDAAVPELSIVIPTLNAAGQLSSCITATTQWPTTPQLIVVDGGSNDDTVRLARDAGATVLASDPGRGQQLAQGGTAATGQWLMFLHADTELQDGWVSEVRAFIDEEPNKHRAAAFRFKLDDDAPQARRVERMVAWRCRALGLPYGDQGLLIHRDFYEQLGGYRSLPLMEDVDLVRRVGKQRVHIFEAAAVTSADRFRRNGWWARPLRNLFCLLLYICGVPPRWIVKLYG
ncbi:MAG: glycosyltransferase family 2 protein [Rhodospirillaceae bacterium]|nr:glycosyltransferase family 2 protein [Rhodospirillaceae bacterium]MBT5239063.1 glycosyltransferase family 2 protein [Rhodospirillaceae bacterium]MBT5565356.1 glycosyltransferase family 2 protein [Rhodospirillaceae bacterium]MBT6089095.1 glycosyltransferase family 2 protein [Rhodospirillaceae bacterium]MBT6960285.1 glycosyltransferase family 2 protein [Rhodospirillaceae bacterium]